MTLGLASNLCVEKIKGVCSKPFLTDDFTHPVFTPKEKGPVHLDQAFSLFRVKD